MNAGHHRSRALLGALLAVALAALALAACGSDDSVGSVDTGPPSAEQFRADVNGYCSDGVQEAVALPLPAVAEEVANDAAARAQIVAEVRDAVLPLGAPEGEGQPVAAYLSELSADHELLLRIQRTAREGGDYSSELRLLDESAGQAALELELDECAALANAIARTP